MQPSTYRATAMCLCILTLIWILFLVLTLVRTNSSFNSNGLFILLSLFFSSVLTAVTVTQRLHYLCWFLPVSLSFPLCDSQSCSEWQVDIRVLIAVRATSPGPVDPALGCQNPSLYQTHTHTQAPAVLSHITVPVSCSHRGRDRNTSPCTRYTHTPAHTHTSVINHQDSRKHRHIYITAQSQLGRVLRCHATSLSTSILASRGQTGGYCVHTHTHTHTHTQTVFGCFR